MKNVPLFVLVLLCLIHIAAGTSSSKKCNIKVGFEYEVNDLTVQFTNVSLGDYDEITWNFGDRQESQEPNPMHKYNETGTYRFCLTINNNNCSCKREYCGYVYVFDPCE